MERQRSTAGKGPGRYSREKTSLIEFFYRFPDDEAVEKWFMEARWPDGVRCPRCKGLGGEIVGIDETWIGGRARNMHRSKRSSRKERLRRKSIIVGAKQEHHVS